MHLQWLGDATLSIEAIGHLPQPLLWSLHDQWPFCGAELYTPPPGPGESESSDRCRPMHIVCPSTWLAGCARLGERLWHPARIAGMVAEVYRQAMESHRSASLR